MPAFLLKIAPGDGSEKKNKIRSASPFLDTSTTTQLDGSSYSINQSIDQWIGAKTQEKKQWHLQGRDWKSGPLAVASTPVFASPPVSNPAPHPPRGTSEYAAGSIGSSASAALAGR